ncbi:MAG: 2-hydroxyacid dehydrogenase [Aeromicrobium sp.]
MTLVTLPFAPGRLQEVSTDLEFARFVAGDQTDHLAETEFWVPPYGFTLDFASVLPQMPKLRAIQTQSAGVDHIIDFVDPSITLCNARGVHDAATSELGVGMIIASLRGFPRFVRAQDRGEWDQDQALISLADRKVLIVGYGSIGQALERRLAGFEVSITRVARTAREGVHGFDELPGLVPNADVIVLLAPLNPETHHLVDASFLKRMKDGALLVNLARGPLVDTDALVAEASTGRIRAAVDVTDPEPLPAGHPLWALPTVLITPHIAGGTTAMRSRIQKLLREQLKRFTEGQPLENVIPH